jgi:hypothetical protein
MSLPTDPFAAPSSGPLALDLARAQEREGPRGPSRRRIALAAATGTLAVGAVAAGVSFGTGGPQQDLSAASTSSLAPEAGAAATLVPPAAGAPIVPQDPTPPVVTTRPQPEADTATPTTTTHRAPTTRSQSSDREQEVRALVAAMQERAAQIRAQAWEDALQRAAAHGRAGGHGHRGGY